MQTLQHYWHLWTCSFCACVHRDSFIIFAGGMPRASYGDRHTVTAMQGSMHHVFDFTSRVVDFVTLNTADELESYDKIG